MATRKPTRGTAKAPGKSAAGATGKRQSAKRAKPATGRAARSGNAKQISKELREQWSDKKGAAMIEDYIRSGAGSKHFKI